MYSLRLFPTRAWSSVAGAAAGAGACCACACSEAAASGPFPLSPRLASGF